MDEEGNLLPRRRSNGSLISDEGDDHRAALLPHTTRRHRQSPTSHVAASQHNKDPLRIRSPRQMMQGVPGGTVFGAMEKAPRVCFNAFTRGHGGRRQRCSLHALFLLLLVSVTAYLLWFIMYAMPATSPDVHTGFPSRPAPAPKDPQDGGVSRPPAKDPVAAPKDPLDGDVSRPSAKDPIAAPKKDPLDGGVSRPPVKDPITTPKKDPLDRDALNKLGDWQSVQFVGDGRYTAHIPVQHINVLYRPPSQAEGFDAWMAWHSQVTMIADQWSHRPHPGTARVLYGAGHKNKRVLVTGGAGFVGSHLVDRLMLAGHDVIVLDNFFTGSRENVAHWIGHPRFELREGDVTLENNNEAGLASLEVDQIYHLACPASPPHYQLNPIKTIKTSVLGTMNMLGLAKRVKARILFTSTSEVYGDPEEHPQSETYHGHVNPIGPRACYDEGKRVAETLMYNYHQQNKVDIRVARIFNTFGPRMNEDDGRVVSNFILAALQGRNLQIYGSGQQTRSFQYVHDLVDGLIALMESDHEGGPVNLGNPEEYTMNAFADYVLETVKATIPSHKASTSKVTHVRGTVDDPRKRLPNIDRAKTSLHWQPKFSVLQGLVETVRYFRHRLEDKANAK